MHRNTLPCLTLPLFTRKYCTTKATSNPQCQANPNGPLEAPSTSLDTATRRKKLFYQSRYRGMAEMEYILHTYAETNLEKMKEDELTQWENILRTGDSELYKWIVQKKNDAVNSALREQAVSAHLIDSVQKMKLYSTHATSK